MGNYTEIEKKLELMISRLSVNDFQEGVPYIQAKEFCNSYEEYQYCCNIIDAEFLKTGTDPFIVSQLHSTFERLYFLYDVHRERLGNNSRRFAVTPQNAAPGAFNGISVGNGTRTVFFPSYFMVAEGKIYRKLPPNGEWGVISNTIFCPISINYNLEKQTEVYTIAYRWHDQVHTFNCLPSEIYNLKYIRKLADRGIN